MLVWFQLNDPVKLEPTKVQIKSQSVEADARTTVSDQPSQVSDKKLGERLRRIPQENHAPLSLSAPAYRGTQTSGV